MKLDEDKHKDFKIVYGYYNYGTIIVEKTYTDISLNEIKKHLGYLYSIDPDFANQYVEKVKLKWEKEYGEE